MKKIGLLGLGRSGTWSIDIDEVFDSKIISFGLTISKPPIDFQIDLKSLKPLDKIVKSLRASQKEDEEIICLPFFGSKMKIWKDEGRLKFVFLGQRKTRYTEMFEIYFDKSEIEGFCEALELAIEDAKSK